MKLDDELLIRSYEGGIVEIRQGRIYKISPSNLFIQVEIPRGSGYLKWMGVDNILEILG